jgi:hypothetical protein
MLLDKAFQTKDIFNTEADLFHYLNKQGSVKWHFNQYSPKLLACFLKEAKDQKEKSFIYMASQAVRQEQDLIVICKGDVENPTLFLLTPGLNVAALQREWTKHYCAAHGLYVLQE